MKKWLAIAGAVLLGIAGVAAAGTVFAAKTGSACAPATVQQCATTTYTIPTDTVSGGTTTAPAATTTARPSSATIKGYYDQGSNQLSDWNRYKAYGFNLVVAGIEPSLLEQVKADGATAWVQPDVWTGCGYEFSITQALRRARRAVA